MDALQILRNDHRRVRDLFRQFGEAPDASTRKAIAHETVAELMIHSQLEEEVFDPAMERAGMSNLIGHAEEEHRAAENVMNEIIELDGRDGELESKFMVLVELVTEHVTEEESQIFPRAAELGMDRLERIGDELQELRMRIESTPPTQRRRPQRRAATTAAARRTSGSRNTGRTSGAARSTTRAGAGSKVTRSQRERDRSRKAKSTSASRRTTAKASTRSGNRTRTSGMASMTKQQLYERAQKADIVGRSSMNKGQLVRALQKVK
jgi:Hemerythrin HHE cation binding domain